MAYQVIDGVKVWGQHDAKTIEQLKTCMQYGSVADAALMADGHFGYSQPIGGVIAYRDHVSPSGVGYDIACGNKAVRTNLTFGDIKNDLSRIADEVAAQVQFGIGKNTHAADKGDHPLFLDDRWDVFREAAGKQEMDKLRSMARGQLGTVGSGNHYVDIFAECVDVTDVVQDDAPVWIGVHFGSRGFGHKTATGFMNLTRDVEFFGRTKKGEVNEDIPVLIEANSDLGALYANAMNLAGDYAYAGRDYVVNQVLSILGAEANKDIHNHHNYAWLEEHSGEKLWVVRKGATPLHPGQESFIGGSMCDPAVIVRGKTTPTGVIAQGAERTQEQIDSLFSTVHGAGRVMGRVQAKGKECKRCKKRGTTCQPGTLVSPNETQPCDGSGWTRPQGVKPEDFNQIVRDYGIQLRGADLDESPFVYRRLDDVLGYHANTLDILHRLRPVIVCMAGDDVRDPYKD